MFLAVICIALIFYLYPHILVVLEPAPSGSWFRPRLFQDSTDQLTAQHIDRADDPDDDPGRRRTRRGGGR